MYRLILSALTALVFALPTWAAELVMVEQNGCHYCERWDEEIGHIYPKTSEGEFAPLRRVNIRDLPQDLTLKSHPAFTPTFILVEDGTEVGRLEGYPGEDHFWVLISRVMKMSPNYQDTGS